MSSGYQIRNIRFSPKWSLFVIAAQWSGVSEQSGKWPRDEKGTVSAC
jgi:hypothetical protein